MLDHFSDEVASLYNDLYTDTFKVLYAQVEAIYEDIQAPILNEIRAFNDHISRCYWKDVTPQGIEENINKARSHLKRAILDCYKFLDVWYYEQIGLIEKRFHRVDLSTIDNGAFLIAYLDKKQNAIRYTRNAKKIETRNFDESLIEYEKAYQAYDATYEFLFENLAKLQWAKTKFYTTGLFIKVFPWLIAIVLGFFSWQDLTRLFSCLIK